MKINCVHCGSIATIRITKQTSPITWELYCQCPDVFCAHTFVSVVEIIRTCSPSLNPNPEVERQLADRPKPAEDAES
ncbi:MULTISPECIES: ogr/Delta-like zinc finger family protein [Ralstonia solanacearum species complex]|uniref:Ogr/Delta-like zinc finger family protein n=1 Tax=Ralstonia solanacearum TaxID=305 RepID=A0A7X0PZW0_RALSL|nr:ogr/Delta-like zinc finger family protein [Ralstonia solanacearum]ALF87745.1 Ogr/Delta-like zinc finger [Ralstonia solanacearum]ATI27243.1 transcriptional regulator [Ralstonia solanacearum]ATJ86007.1 transcriptional regulator [Ralstonia solanacearum]MBB6582763.1 ogr/Delta-like zinc finger family protein [Ralstonia solanacearum]MDB0522401.1 ogr/Delta-like zinc finger family protein [Ralstonia solanacearum]